MPPKRALEVMARLLREDATQVVALPVNWRKYHEFYPAGTEPPLLAELANEEAAAHRRRRIREKSAARSSMRLRLSGPSCSSLCDRASGSGARPFALATGYTATTHQPGTGLADGGRAEESHLGGFGRQRADGEISPGLQRRASGNPAPRATDGGSRRPIGAWSRGPTREDSTIDEDLLANIDELSEEQVDSMLCRHADQRCGYLVSDVSNRIAGLSSAEKRALLADLLREKARATESFYPLSYNQQGIWFLSQLAPESMVYNVSFAARITSELNVPALRRSFQTLVDRHPCLRTTVSVRVRETGAADTSRREGPLRGVGCFRMVPRRDGASVGRRGASTFRSRAGSLASCQRLQALRAGTLPVAGRASHRDRFLVARDTSE